MIGAFGTRTFRPLRSSGVRIGLLAVMCRVPYSHVPMMRTFVFFRTSSYSLRPRSLATNFSTWEKSSKA